MAANVRERGSWKVHTGPEALPFRTDRGLTINWNATALERGTRPLFRLNASTGVDGWRAAIVDHG